LEVKVFRIRTRDHIIAFLEEYCPRKSIVRAIREGKVELLGGFSAIPPSDRSGWIVKVMSTHDRTWNVAVIPRRAGKDYEIRVVKEIPWSKWVGTWDAHLDNLIGKLYYGDRPWIYYKMWERAKRNENLVGK